MWHFPLSALSIHPFDLRRFDLSMQAGVCCLGFRHSRWPLQKPLSFGPFQMFSSRSSGAHLTMRAFSKLFVASSDGDCGLESQKSLTRGHISLEVTYMPFSEETRDSRHLAKARAKQTMGSTSLNADTKGVLVVHVIRGINLEVSLLPILQHSSIQNLCKMYHLLPSTHTFPKKKT